MIQEEMYRNFFSTYGQHYISPHVEPLRSNLEKLLKSLSPSAATNSSRISSGMTTCTKARNIYAMVQCSKGISGSDCLTCLDTLTVSYMLLLNREEEESGLLVAPSCNLRENLENHDYGGRHVCSFFFGTYNWYLQLVVLEEIPEGTLASVARKSRGGRGNEEEEQRQRGRMKNRQRNKRKRKIRVLSRF